jgi:hypothetical protein
MSRVNNADALRLVGSLLHCFLFRGVNQMSVFQMHACQMPFDQTSVGQMSVGQNMSNLGLILAFEARGLPLHMSPTRGFIQVVSGLASQY